MGMGGRTIQVEIQFPALNPVPADNDKQTLFEQALAETFWGLTLVDSVRCCVERHP